MTDTPSRLHHLAIALCGAAFLLSGCGGDVKAQYPTTEYGRVVPAPTGARPSVFGAEGLLLLGGSERGEGPGAAIPVNSYLWRASLDTLSFMPLASADPFGGVIITDWYTPPESASERFKMTVYILSRELRADGLRVSVFRQLRNGGGTWSDAEVNPATTVDLEGAILTRARELRIASAAR